MLEVEHPAGSTLSGTTCCALVCDHKLAAPAGALAKRLAQLWMVDVHIFIERGTRIGAAVTEVKDVRITYHYEKLFDATLEILLDHPRFTRAAWGRLFVPEFLQLYDRVLYLDVDIIPGPLNCDLSRIELPFGLGMVRDSISLNRKPVTIQGRDPKSSNNSVELRDYFNSGAILFDPSKWDSDWVRAKLKQYNDAGMLTTQYPDQDFINIAFDGKITELSPNMNFQFPLMGLGLITSGTPSICHFTSSLKPFHILPKNGAPELVCVAAEEFKDMLQEAGLGGDALEPYRNPKSLFVLKMLWRKLLEDRGISTKKSRKMRHQWHERRRITQQYLETGIKDGIFSDRFDLQIETSEISTRFNGFEVLPDD
jgi:lipopolysaccharide biosynthesis glycosyltransferase